MRYRDPLQQTAIESQMMPLRRPAQTRVQGDIVQFAQQRAQPVRSTLHGWDRPIGDADVPAAHMANRSARLDAANTPQLFIPLNLNRIYWLIANQTGAIINFSFGYPIGTTAIGINNNQNFQQMGLACSTDDIWIMGAAGAFVTCFEGVPAHPLALRSPLALRALR